MQLAFVTDFVALFFLVGWFGIDAIPLITSRMYSFVTSFVFLKGDFETIWQRHQSRKNHFFTGKAMLETQFQTLIAPTGNNVVSADVRLSIDEIVSNVCQHIKAIG